MREHRPLHPESTLIKTEWGHGYVGLSAHAADSPHRPSTPAPLGAGCTIQARIDELNDPFEFLGVELSDPDFRKALISTKREISKSKGILCFSKSWQHPMLWAHYADKHRGICLGFDVNAEKIEFVSYINSRFPKPNNPLNESFVKKLLLTKFAHWSYEDEYRIYVSLKEQENGYYFAQFSEELSLKQVIVGAESSLSRTDISSALSLLNNDIETFKVRPAFKSFKIVKQKDDQLWT